MRPHADRQTALVEATLKGDAATLEALFLTDPVLALVGVVVALVPAVLRQGAEMVPALRTALLAVSALLGLLAVVALLNPPRRKL